MVQADPKNAVIRRQVCSVSFGFYSDEDVRSRSVVEVTSPQSLDALGTPLPRGLYDPRLGPTEGGSTPCITCGCPYQTCPGHAGHLELCVPVYHPLLFSTLLKLLRIKCLHCHKLRGDARQLEIYKTTFSLVQQGRLKEALELDEAIAHASKGAKADAGSAIDQVLREKQQHSHTTTSTETSYEKELKRNVVKQVISTCLKSKKCEHCGAFSPKIRQDSSNKIFQAPLSAVNARINLAEGITLRSTLQRQGEANTDDNNAAGYQSGDEFASQDLMDVDQGSDAEEKEEEEAEEVGGGRDKYMHALEVEAQAKLTWQKDPVLCNALFGGGVNEGYKVFFLRAIPVPPTRFRPPMSLGTMTVEHAQNASLNKMLTSNDRIRSLLTQQDEKSQAQAYSTWIDLQTTVNCYMDSSKDPGAASSNMQTGIRQILEKKEGIFRKHMMGKRVDFACRSVISPDPYVGTNEIGIPVHFAKVLTYPTPVTDLNSVEMRELVIRGPSNYPGACWVQFPDGRRVDLGRMDPHRREGVAARLLTHMKKGGPPAMVGRQLRNGDMMLVNRQPTLHKPGIMAHSVRVLYSPTQKTIRMHYANCNTYNADFDGDEMNCHFPQNDIASAESKYIVATDLQYIVPTNGSPLRGLIQDHVDSGVKLTSKDSFLEKWEYQQLIFAALASLPGLEVIRSDADIELLPPAIVKPRELWTGKQVISTLLHHLRKGNDRDDCGSRGCELPGITVERKAKTPEHGFGASQQEHLVLIRDGELLRGVLDKAAFGSTEFSLVHAVYEAYGGSKAGLLLNSLGRLFTAYLQYYSGHSCRMEDLILTQAADAHRRRLVQRAYTVGARSAKAWADAEGGKVQIESVKDKPGADKPLKPFEAAAASAKIGQLLSGNEGSVNFAALDGYMQSQLNPLASEIIKVCLPNGLAVPFPANTFGLMVITGAKGSTVNQSQISCALGQQALEGRRVPRLSSGRTLPSFAPYDPNPRADGFIMDRFLTGIRPQEYYFHCMAGREGLVDTAVKTSRSGYLQRCLVKHLEELKVCYDSTVRNGEGGVVQFLYGEDGLDPTKATYLDCSSRTLVFMARNFDAMTIKSPALPGATIDQAAGDAERIEAIEKQSPSLLEVGSFVKARKLRVGSRWIRGALCRGWFDAVIIKCHKEGELDLRYLKDNAVVEHVPLEVELGRCGGINTSAASSTCALIKPAVPDPVLSGATRETGCHRLGSSGACVSEKVAGGVAEALRKDKKLHDAIASTGLSSKDFRRVMAAKYASAICAPGEAVGSIAAQSVGEPSTQMTLNTFHLAGSGANVTLGIPRLREIIMTASKVLKTPTMSVPLNECVSDSDALRLTRFFTRLTLMELISSDGGIVVREALQQSGGGNWERAYFVTLKLHPAERIMEAFGLTLEDVAKKVTKAFMPKLADVMKRELRRSAAEGDVRSIEVLGGASTVFVDDADGVFRTRGPRGNGEDELEGEDEDDDEAIDEEDGVNARRFGRVEEMTSYGVMDDEDRAPEDLPSQGEYDEMDGNDGSVTAARTSDDEMNASSTPDTPNTAEQNVFDSFETGNTVKIDKEQNALILHPLRVDPAARPLLMVGLVERAASITLVRSREKIQQAYINEEEDGRGRCLQTAGVNFEELWKLESVDHNRLASNDIWAVRCAYGVEAARNNIVDQIRSVFGAYGISVDLRHLSLIADYMTFDGGFKAMNRGGMVDSSSPFLQMSFETTAHFMVEAALNSRTESLVSPSANIVLGRPVRHGTGAFDLFIKVS